MYHHHTHHAAGPHARETASEMSCLPPLATSYTCAELVGSKLRDFASRSISVQDFIRAGCPTPHRDSRGGDSDEERSLLPALSGLLHVVGELAYPSGEHIDAPDPDETRLAQPGAEQRNHRSVVSSHKESNGISRRGRFRTTPCFSRLRD